MNWGSMVRFLIFGTQTQIFSHLELKIPVTTWRVEIVTAGSLDGQ